MSASTVSNAAGGAAGQVVVDHSEAQERYRASVAGQQVGYLDYMTEVDRVVLTHTVIHDRYAGNGYAGQLVEYVLNDLRASGKKIVPVCSYIVSYIERHPEHADLVA